MSNLIDRAEAQTAIQLVAKRYTVAHEAHGEGTVDWCANLITVTDAMNALRKVPSAQPEIICCKDCKHKGTKNCVANACTTIFGVTVKDYFYCGLAERGTDE